jgi:hypothetical protein
MMKGSISLLYQNRIRWKLKSVPIAVDCYKSIKNIKFMRGI